MFSSSYFFTLFSVYAISPSSLKKKKKFSFVIFVVFQEGTEVNVGISPAIFNCLFSAVPHISLGGHLAG